jgi:hypothetical protein
MASINKVVGGANQNVALDPKYANVKTEVVAKVPPALPVGLGGTVVAGEVESKPLQQTFVPPQAPTADQIRLAGGVDAFVKSQLPTGTEQRTTGLQDLPVGVSIEADGQFTGTGGLGAVQAPRVGTPIVKRDFLDPSMSMSRREVLSDPTRFTGPAGAGIGPVSEDETLQTGLATDFNRFAERADQTPITAPRTADDKPVISQTDAMLGQFTGTSGTLPQIGPTAPQPVAPFTPLSRPSDISRLMPTTADIQAQQAADARKAREEQERMIYEETQKRIAKEPKTKPKEKEISDAEYKRNVKEATDKVYDEARKRGDQARDEVLRQGGSVEEAYDAMHTAFTGFDRSGNMVDPNVSDPFSDVPSFGAFKEGGLASKPKRTKPKKRNTKKGLGGRMAT